MDSDVLGLLAKLQSVADEIDRLEAGRRGALEKKDRTQGELQNARRSLEEHQSKHHELDIERRKREMALKSEKERMQRVKSRLGEVKTSREYQAVLTEISSAKQVITEQEEAILKDMEALESLSSEVEHLKARAAGAEADLAAAENDLAKMLFDTDTVVAAHKNSEAEILRSLPLEVVDRYRLIRTRRGGLAVVEARNEACTACFMRIPPQTYIEVIRGTKIIQCPNCHRILIPPQEGPAETDQAE